MLVTSGKISGCVLFHTSHINVPFPEKTKGTTTVYIACSLTRRCFEVDAVTFCLWFAPEFSPVPLSACGLSSARHVCCSF